jgi:hypothetical protein
VFDGSWHHVAGVKRLNNAEIWIDGVQQGIGTLTLKTTDDGQFAIGADGACCQDFTGFMDEAKIWNRALSQAEIQAEAAH